MAEKTGENTETSETTQKTAGEGSAAVTEKASGGRTGDKDEAAREAKIAELEAAKKTLEEENLALKDQYLRTKADTDNFRKRLLKEKQESIQFANKQLLTDLLPVLDDFERAVKSSEASKDFTAFHDGIVLIEKRFSELLDRKWSLKRFVSVGEEFDPQKHEALYSETVAGHTAQMVLEDYMTGYFLHDKVLRAAKVKVSMPAPAGGKQSGEESSEAPEGAD